MATENTKLWFESLESIFRDIHNIARDLQFAEEAHRTTAETIRTAKDAIRAAEETHRKGSEAFHRMKETLRTLQESESDMSGACKAWQDSIRANNVNAEIVNKHFQKLARSRQSSYSQTPTPSMNSDHIPNELLLSGHHSGYTPELSQPTSPNRRSSSRAESPLGRLPNTHKTTKRHAVNVNSDPPSHADTVLSGVSSRYASTQPRSIASNHLGQWSSAQLMSELAYNTAPINSSPVQDSQEKQQAKAHTSASIAEYLKSEKNHESSHHEEPAMDTEDVRGHVCLSCLRSWEKSLKDKVPLKEGCVYNPGETDCSECIALKRHGPQECRKILSGQSKTLRRLKREFCQIPSSRRWKSPEATKFKEGVTKEIQILENTKKRKKKKTSGTNESEPTTKKSRSSRGRSKSVAASKSRSKDSDVCLKLEGETAG